MRFVPLRAPALYSNPSCLQLDQMQVVRIRFVHILYILPVCGRLACVSHTTCIERFQVPDEFRTRRNVLTRDRYSYTLGIYVDVAIGAVFEMLHID